MRLSLKSVMRVIRRINRDKMNNIIANGPPVPEPYNPADIMPIWWDGFVLTMIVLFIVTSLFLVWVSVTEYEFHEHKGKQE